MRHPDDKIIYGLFDTVDDLDNAFTALTKADIPEDDISLLMSEDTHGTDFEPLFKDRTADGATAGGILGTALGGVLGGLACLGLGATGVGVMVVGPALAFGAAGGVIGGLMAHGVPEEEAALLHQQIHSGKVMMAVHTRRPNEVRIAQRVFEAHGGEEVTIPQPA